MANPHAGDTPHWEAAFDYYYQDQVEAAFAEVTESGVGEGADLLRWYRVIEAEFVTRKKSRTIDVTPWLQMEFVPDQLMGLEEELAQRTLAACDEVAQRIGWSHGSQTLLSILASETEAPWAANPYGYCVSKEPYEKICLPNYLVDDPLEFGQAVAHEYAHVISTNIADEYAPRWVEEAVSVLVERRFDRGTWSDFKADRTRWLSERELEFALTDRTEDEEARKEEIWNAYQQAGWIGRYLAELKGENSLGAFLREIANESPVANILRSFRGQDRTDRALRQVYGVSKRELFDRAYDWMCQASVFSD
ncbi:MAG: hypothetical protein P4L46_08900 [Fimbriimonas sp.]|nr:hypothetical protein [Fimbriimonas sp.]